MCPSIRPLDMIPVSEVQKPFNLSVALTLCFLLSWITKPEYLCLEENTSCFSTLLFGISIALFVRKEVLFSSFRRFPQNRSNGVAIFDGNPIRYNNAFIQPSSLLYEPFSIGKQLSKFLLKLEWRNKIDNYGYDNR